MSIPGTIAVTTEACACCGYETLPWELVRKEAMIPGVMPPTRKETPLCTVCYRSGLWRDWQLGLERDDHRQFIAWCTNLVLSRFPDPPV